MMAFYEEKTTTLSKKYLKDIFKKVNEKQLQVGLCGGWAVHFLLEKKGNKHLESKDIDLFFDPEKTSKNSIVEIMEDIGFTPHSTFRWCKFLDYETLREITEEESKKRDLYQFIQFYIDLLPTKKVEGEVFHEPLLEQAFQNGEEYNFEGTRILIPAPRTMIEVKTKSSMQRREEDKKQKDLADLYQLISSTEEAWKHTTEGERTTLNIPINLKRPFDEKLDTFIEDGSIAAASTTTSTIPGTMIGVFKKAYTT